MKMLHPQPLHFLTLLKRGVNNHPDNAPGAPGVQQTPPSSLCTPHGNLYESLAAPESLRPAPLCCPSGFAPGEGWQGSKTTAPHTHLVIEKANLEDVLHTGNAVCHRQITHGVPQQDDARPSAQLLEILCTLQDAVVLVVGVDERSLETLEDSLCKQDGQTDPTAIPPLCRSLSTLFWNGQTGWGMLTGHQLSYQRDPQGVWEPSSHDAPRDSPQESPFAGQALPRW